MNESQPTQMMSPDPAQPNSAKRKSRTPWIIAGIVGLVSIAGVALWWWLAANNDTPPATGEVTITDNNFEPSTIRIRKGQSVTWTNRDGKEHHIYADQSTVPGLDSQEPLGQGDSYSFTFDKEGTYHYFDSLHPTRLTGTVIVE